MVIFIGYEKKLPSWKYKTYFFKRTNFLPIGYANDTTLLLFSDTVNDAVAIRIIMIYDN